MYCHNLFCHVSRPWDAYLFINNHSIIQLRLLSIHNQLNGHECFRRAAFSVSVLTSSEPAAVETAAAAVVVAAAKAAAAVIKVVAAAAVVVITAVVAGVVVVVAAATPPLTAQTLRCLHRW